MKKITLLFAVIIAAVSVQLNAQNCTPDHTGYTVVPSNGVMLPLPLPNATVNVAYQQTVTIGVPDTVRYLSFEVPLNWLKINHIASSNGNTWTVVNSTGGTVFDQWNPLSWQCVTLLGTPVNSGMDSIVVFVDAQVSFMGAPASLNNQAGGKLAILVQAAQAIGAEYMDNSVSVFPNPSVDGNYSLTMDQQYEMTVCDITGRILSTETVREGTANLNLGNESAGIYFVRLKNDNYSKVIRIVRK